MDENSFGLPQSQSSQLSVMESGFLDDVSDPMDTFQGANPWKKKAFSTKTRLEQEVKSLVLSVDTQTQALQTAKAELSEVDRKVGVLDARIKMAQGMIF